MSTIYMQSADGQVFTTEHPEYHKECTRLTREAGRIARRDYCRAQLRKMLKPGDTVYTILRRCAESGMSRDVSVVVSTDTGIRCLDSLVADATDYTLAKGQGVRMSGCGMDMGFALVYALGSALWPEGTPEPHGRRNGEPDSCGGYALRHEWL